MMEGFKFPCLGSGPIDFDVTAPIWCFSAILLSIDPETPKMPEARINGFDNSNPQRFMDNTAVTHFSLNKIIIFFR